MRKQPTTAAIVVGVLLAAGLIATPAATVTAAPSLAAAIPLTQHVDPFIGTGMSNAPDPVPGGAGGATVPGPVMPFGMVQFSPDTPLASPSGYRHSDTTVEEFSLTHFNGAGCANNEDIGILPITGNLTTSPGTTWTSYAGKYSKANEAASPGYYRTVLDNYGATQVELSSTRRSAAMRLTYPSTRSAQILLNTSRNATGSRSGSVAISGRTVTGTFTGGGFCHSTKTHQIFYRMEFDRTPTAFGTWLEGTVSPGSASANGVRSGGYLTFDTTTNRTVQVKVGISFVSLAGAQANLAAEQPGFAFDTVRANAVSEWNLSLNRIQVTGGTSADLRKFYTALYHVLVNPNLASDVDGRYRGFDNQIHSAGHPVYQNFAGWDIYRSWAALIALIAPDEASDMAKSMVLAGQQGGLLPKWSQNHNEHAVMMGDPGPIVVSSMHAFGARGFDTAAALTIMDRSSYGGTMQGIPLRARQEGYVARQYVHENAADSLEYSASDFAVAQFARAVGDTARYNAYIRRSQWWRNLYHPAFGYLQDRAEDGSWPAPLDPISQTGYAEGNATQYTWMVPYNYRALIELMGGRQTAIQRLDHHFTQLNGGLSRPYFYIGNEPEHGVPWIYHFAGVPAKTSAVVRRVMTESFTNDPGGLPGNDDLGATSAWLVWAALGMYPTTPGSDTLALHGPSFPSILIDRPTGDIRIDAANAGTGSPYVQGVSVDGAVTSRPWLRYADIGAGATLSYTMGPNPSTWGTDPDDAPPSIDDGFSPPPAPDLGPNLAAGGLATGSTPCSTGEGPAMAFDGKLGTKWCTLATDSKVLQVDLGSTQDVTGFVLKNAALGGESTNLNTQTYRIETSTDGAGWATAVQQSEQLRNSRTYHPIVATPARHVRLTITSANNVGGAAARIPEFEVYGVGGPTNLAGGGTATASPSCTVNEGPPKAINGTVDGGITDKWCSSGTDKWLSLDLGAASPLTAIIVRHAAAGAETPAWNTRDYDLRVSEDGDTWTTLAQVRGNTASVTRHDIAVSGRYVRLDVLVPAQNNDAAARIFELEVYGIR
ncbi:GH92 family glycosyl hydrolase [Micromonospora chokoriensis]|uniref:GH92 family glycosyl hydrolase n=1 Tax=Micromonospora chokoriensis TaxID=356851 RepID=UPI001E4F3DC1|nr:GH92 family glycosyl hydrolase [Micromonospora chokoriensis]